MNEKKEKHEMVDATFECRQVVQPIVFVEDYFTCNDDLNQLLAYPYRYAKENIHPKSNLLTNDHLIMANHFMLMNISEIIITKIGEVVERYFLFEPYMYDISKFVSTDKIYKILEQTAKDMSSSISSAKTNEVTSLFYMLINAMFSASVVAINSFIQDFCSNYVFGVGEYRIIDQTLYAHIYKLLYHEEIKSLEQLNETSRSHQYSTCAAAMREMFEPEMPAIRDAIMIVCMGACGIWFG